MSTTQALNQDDVLGGPEDLSPSAFGEGPGDAAAKKKSTLLPMLGGIAVAVLIVGFFGWKIAAPYLNRNQTAEAIQPLPAAKQSAQEIPQYQQPARLPQSDAVSPAQMPPVNGEPRMTALQGMPQNQSTQLAVAPQAQPGPAMSAQPARDAQQSTPTNSAMADGATGQATAPLQGAPSANAPAATQAQTQGDLAIANARIDALEKSLAALKDSVDKLAASSAAKPAPVEKDKEKPTAEEKASPRKASSKAASAKKPVVQEKASTGSKKSSGDEDSKPAARSDLHLKAVLDGRAWFQTRGGESVTVAPGDEVKGMGTVKSIDAERGQVLFSNGTVVR
ncbi:hypothetical protein [Cupriavidus pinatubonensis]|uniref:Uncharacterized protein n=1 Tax=Cupriavidus pinatubonensis TaxID=248026 RepID=A0ABM8WRD5_9BURK|nr:hypothetical protein [Cupriavidus pinatubonensis]CAG9170013.1 hypothetical protein LMG23994_01776 [Cupriavidus pinatubonensis]